MNEYIYEITCGCCEYKNCEECDYVIADHSKKKKNKKVVNDNVNEEHME